VAPSIVKRYLIAFGKYKTVGFGIFALAVGVSGLMGLQEPPPPVYQATGVMGLNSLPLTLSETGPNIQEAGRQALSREFLLAEPVLKAVGEQVGLDPRILKSAYLKTPSEDEPPLYKVSFKDSTPERAEAVVKLLMQGAIEQSRQLNQSRLDALIYAIDQRLPEVQQELREVEDRLVQFDRVEGAAIIMAQNGVLVGKIQSAIQQQEQLRLKLEEINAQMRSLEGQLGLSIDEAYSASALSRDPIVKNLQGQIYQVETQQALLGQTLRPDHPQMVELQRQLSGLEGLLTQRAQEVLGGEGVATPFVDSQRIRRASSLDPTRQEMAARLLALKTQKDTLQEGFVQAQRLEREFKATYMSLPDLQLERQRLAQEVALTKALYDQLQARRVDTEAARAETVSNLSIAQEPEVKEQREEAPNVAMLLLLGSGVGLAAGGASIFLLSALEGKFYTMEEVRSALQERDLPILGTIPHVVSFESIEPVQMPAILAPDSPYLPYYERLRSNLRRVEGEAPPKVVLVTSAGALEGKTFTAYNLAIASARAGKRTLLVEADLRSPSQAASLKVAVDPNSIAEPLRHYGNFDEGARFVPPVPNLYVMTSPGPQPHPAAIVESSEMRQLLAQARVRFDFVVVDAPSLSSCNDALLLEPHTDGLILVARPAFTESGLLAEYAEMLEEAEDSLRVLGAVVNDAEISIELPLLPHEEEMEEMDESIDLFREFPSEPESHRESEEEAPAPFDSRIS